jgi:undecaprenyl-diphosphatase
MSKTGFFGLLLSIFLAAMILTVVALNKHLFPGDLFLSQSIQSLITSRLTLIMTCISWPFGDWTAAILTASIVIVVWRFMGRLEAILIATAGMITVLNYAFKAIIGRPRPSAQLVQILAQETNNGFPSSHAFYTSICIGMLAYLLYAHSAKRYQRMLTILLSIILILLVGFSRVYLGVHWTSDVIGGYLFGSFFLVVLIYFYRWRSARTVGRES